MAVRRRRLSLMSKGRLRSVVIESYNGDFQRILDHGVVEVLAMQDVLVPCISSLNGQMGSLCTFKIDSV